MQVGVIIEMANSLYFYASILLSLFYILPLEVVYVSFVICAIFVSSVGASIPRPNTLLFATFLSSVATLGSGGSGGLRRGRHHSLLLPGVPAHGRGAPEPVGQGKLHRDEREHGLAARR